MQKAALREVRPDSVGDKVSNSCYMEAGCSLLMIDLVSK